MAIKGGDLIHAGNQVLLDRIQTAGPGQLNVPTEKIYELGNYQAVGTILDIPDLSFPMESFDASAEFESVLIGGITFRNFTGDMTAASATLTAADGNFTAADVGASVVVQGAGTAGADLSTTIASVGTATTATLTAPAATTVTGAGVELSPPSGTVFDINKCRPMDIASQFKTGKNATNPYDVSMGVAVPFLTLEQLSYRFGLRENAQQSATLRGDSIFYTPGSVYVDVFAGTNTANQAITVGRPAYPYRGDTVGGVKYVLGVMLRSGKRLRKGVDYTETATVSGATASVSLTIVDPVPTTDAIRVIYSSSTVATYPQVSHAVSSATRPAAIRGRNIQVYVGGVAVTDQWTGVQQVTTDWRVTLDRDEEFGNSEIVGQDYDVPEVNGTIDFKPRDPQELVERVRQIAGVPDTEVVGALQRVKLNLDIVLHSPDTGEVLKTLRIPDARFTVPGYSGRVQQKLTVTFNYESDGGNLKVYKGTAPAP